MCEIRIVKELEMDGGNILLAYHSRFQIELLYRDAKQHLGLTQYQARSKDKKPVPSQRKPDNCILSQSGLLFERPKLVWKTIFYGQLPKWIPFLLFPNSIELPR